jgi:cytidylate kinase
MAMLEENETPLHGYRGPTQAAARPGVPAGLTIAISREAGARGGSIAKRAGIKLGWQVYTQEMMEYLSQEGGFRQEIATQLPKAAIAWIDEQQERLLHEQNLSRNPTVLDLSRMVLALGAQGEAIMLGRGAGLLLPTATTLNIRLVAPLADRIAYMSQWLRLSEEEAAEEVRQRDQRRADFLFTHFHRKAGDVHQYDMVLNTRLLGEERCADLIVHAAKAKMSAFAAE